MAICERTLNKIVRINVTPIYIIYSTRAMQIENYVHILRYSAVNECSYMKIETSKTKKILNFTVHIRLGDVI